MEPDERDFTGHRFVPYDDVMESIAAKMRIPVTFDQLPIKDLSVPTERHMTRILNQINLFFKKDRPIYVHCLGGIGRTGTFRGGGLEGFTEVLKSLSISRLPNPKIVCKLDNFIIA
jgi:predicted protein tyrosine phosphatase